MTELPMETSCREVRARLDAQTEFLLLDCREVAEYELVRIENARLLPMSEMENRVADLADYRDSPLVVYCHLGVRSAQVTAWLRQQGFARAQSMAGGIDLWAQVIEPGMRRY